MDNKIFALDEKSLYKYIDNELYVYLEHPGGPFWESKDKWSIVKGEYINEKQHQSMIKDCEELKRILMATTRTLSSKLNVKIYKK